MGILQNSKDDFLSAVLYTIISFCRKNSSLIS